MPIAVLYFFINYENGYVTFFNVYENFQIFVITTYKYFVSIQMFWSALFNLYKVYKIIQFQNNVTSTNFF